MKTQIGTGTSMNGKDAVRQAEKPTSYLDPVGQNPNPTKCCEHQTGTVEKTTPILNTETLMEAALERKNMQQAYKRVKQNKGAPGVDKMTVEDLKDYLRRYWPQIRDELLAGRYEPQPVRVVEIPKLDGGVRQLGIPTVVDRLIQQALHQAMSPIFEAGFSESSHGFRPGRGAHQAIQKATEYVAEGNDWIVDIDLEKFFDRVNHDILMSRVARKVKDKRVLLLIRRYLQAGTMIGGLETIREEGTPQGGPLSPLLSNILLDDLDKELEKRGHKFARYADDCNIYVQSEVAGRRVMASIKEFLGSRLKLKVNESKSAVARPWELKFLGYSMTSYGKPKLKIATKAIGRLKDKIREKIRKGRGRKLQRTIAEMKPLLKGWMNYFKLTEEPTALKDLEQWIRRKLRGIIWRQMKKPWTRAQTLIKRGVEKSHAWNTIKGGNGPWRNARSFAMHSAYSNSYFESIGLISLTQEWKRLRSAS
jgi:RNA-directed DNA polymerase